MNDDRLMKTETAAKYIDDDFPPSTLVWWRCKGLGPAYVKIGRHVYYRLSALDAFIKSSERRPEEAA